MYSLYMHALECHIVTGIRIFLFKRLNVRIEGLNLMHANDFSIVPPLMLRLECCYEDDF